MNWAAVGVLAFVTLQRARDPSRIALAVDDAEQFDVTAAKHQTPIGGAGLLRRIRAGAALAMKARRRRREAKTLQRPDCSGQIARQEAQVIEVQASLHGRHHTSVKQMFEIFLAL